MKPIWQTDENEKYASNCDFDRKNHINEEIIQVKFRTECSALCVANINCSLYNWCDNNSCALKYGNPSDFKVYFNEYCFCGIVTRN